MAPAEDLQIAALQPRVRFDADTDKGRQASRSAERDDTMDTSEGGGVSGTYYTTDAPARKRRRSRKGLDKKFLCPEEGCGKSYSRAEHLYRHQLNHNAKVVYKCSFPDCNRSFVRQDLRTRHEERHTAKGSSLTARRDSISHVSPLVDEHPSYYGRPTSVSPEAGSLEPPSSSSSLSLYPKLSAPGHTANNSTSSTGTQIKYPPPPNDPSGSPYTPVSNSSPHLYPGANHGPGGASDSYSNPPDHLRLAPPGQPHRSPQPPLLTLAAPASSVDMVVPPPPPPPPHHPFGIHPASQYHAPPPHHNIMQVNLAQPGYIGEQPPGGATSHHPQQYGQPTSQSGHHQQPQDLIMLDSMPMQPSTVPVFGNEGLTNKSPYAIPEDFIAYLFNSQTGDSQPAGNSNLSESGQTNYGDYQSSTYGVPYPSRSGTSAHFQSSSQHIMAVNSLLDQVLPEATISEEKGQEIFNFIKERFHERNQSVMAANRRDRLLSGNRSDSNHVLSTRMMQAYIGSYWLHFSDQMPIIHQPSFSPDKTPTVLLLAMMTIGAVYLDEGTNADGTSSTADVSNYFAWNLRWEVFMDSNFAPPSKLWIFQTLILLEMYEKLYSSRELHERAHIHHATTITLMRRGRSLIGKSAIDSPLMQSGSSSGGSVNGGQESNSNNTVHTPEEWWANWVANETTRRTAFAAFVIDSLHATMFGHSTVMVAHEMRLPLPCDDSLWKATSSAEVNRLEANQHSNGIEPVSFLEGLRKTLSNEEVHTTSFGRTVLMSGLLSVSWHMKQRDLQINVLGSGVSTALGVRDRWRQSLARAFDSWREEYDKALYKTYAMSDPYRYSTSKRTEANSAFGTRTILHHLSHMALHGDIVDSQVFARARRLLGRAISPQDLASVQKRMCETWAPSAEGRDAAFYALKLICSVLLMPAEGGSNHYGGNNHNRFSADIDPYSARGDFLLNRPWALYYAGLILWSYAFALQGPCPQIAVPTERHETLAQMRSYISRYGGIKTPDDLCNAGGLNENSAILIVLRDAFRQTRWELLHEAANLFNNCVVLNSGGIP